MDKWQEVYGYKELMKQEMDLRNWDRKEHFEYYSKCSTPHYCVAFNIDITNLLRFTREHQISFYYSLIYPLPVNALEGMGEAQIIYSCIPWADITMCSNERDYNDPKLKDDTAPILVWGKYTENNGRYMINMTLDVNHRLIDGYFVGLFVQKLEEMIAALE